MKFIIIRLFITETGIEANTHELKDNIRDLGDKDNSNLTEMN